MSDFAPAIIECPLPEEVTACHAHIVRLEVVAVELQATLDERQAANEAPQSRAPQRR